MSILLASLITVWEKLRMNRTILSLIAIALSACAGQEFKADHIDQIPAACAELNITQGLGYCRVAPGVICYFDAAGMPSDSKSDRAFDCENSELIPVQR